MWCSDNGGRCCQEIVSNGGCPKKQFIRVSSSTSRLHCHMAFDLPHTWENGRAMPQDARCHTVTLLDGAFWCIIAHDLQDYLHMTCTIVHANGKPPLTNGMLFIKCTSICRSTKTLDSQVTYIVFSCRQNWVYIPRGPALSTGIMPMGHLAILPRSRELITLIHQHLVIFTHLPASQHNSPEQTTQSSPLQAAATQQADKQSLLTIAWNVARQGIHA
jgi:hypothetical protein